MEKQVDNCQKEEMVPPELRATVEELKNYGLDVVLDDKGTEGNEDMVGIFVSGLNGLVPAIAFKAGAAIKKARVVNYGTDGDSLMLYFDRD